MRQYLEYYFISRLLSLINPKAKISQVNAPLVSMASTQPVPWVAPIQNTGLSGASPPLGMICQVFITAAPCSDFSGNKTIQARFHPNPQEPSLWKPDPALSDMTSLPRSMLDSIQEMSGPWPARPTLTQLSA